MRVGWRGTVPWVLGWAVLAFAGAALLVRVDIAQRREAFQTDARIAHRLLSQRAVQHDAVLETLVLLAPASREGGPARAAPEAALGAVLPQVVGVLRREPGRPWADAALQAADERSRSSRHGELAAVDVVARQFTVVRHGEPSSFALRIDLERMVPWDEWPVDRLGPIGAVLVQGGQRLVIQPGAGDADRPAGLTPGFVAAKVLASPSQPFDLQLQRATGPAQWPWRALVALLAGLAAATWALRAVLMARQARRRAEALLRVGQVSRLNAMGELAAGVAHELNQPLTALMASTQAARRLLDDEPPELDTARQAMAQASAQARRAAEVVSRLRRLVETPGQASATATVALDDAARQMLDLVEPQARRLGVVTRVEGDAVPVRADPVALEQIVHNLVSNALQALERVPASERRLTLQVAAEAGQGVLTVRDHGPGIAPDALPRLFEPFFTTREGGLGLGLSLCESLAQAMHGSLSARNADGRGAEFRLALPLAEAPR